MATKKTFNFKLGDELRLPSGQQGRVIGRAHYVSSNPQYRLRYIDGTGSDTEAWWDEDALDAV